MNANLLAVARHNPDLFEIREREVRSGEGMTMEPVVWWKDGGPVGDREWLEAMRLLQGNES
jgi:hypothetical protein